MILNQLQFLLTTADYCAGHLHFSKALREIPGFQTHKHQTEGFFYCCFFLSVKRNSRKLMMNLPNVIPSLFLVWEILPNEEHFHTVSCYVFHVGAHLVCLVLKTACILSIDNFFFFHFSGVLGFCFSINSKYSNKGLMCHLLMHYW